MKEENLREKNINGKKRTKKYEQKHKELFLALFQGSADVNSNGKVIVGRNEWDWTDPDVQYFVRKIRFMKKDIQNYCQKEIEGMFGK